ncbi:ABC transporter permease [Desulfobacter sp.]|uniref:ABC transporter permease n=1 Tax=Desulfobacter sp. TaxID=2294 RepID=UPI003D0B9E8B
MIEISLKMLFGERAKYAILVSGICFATILITQGMAMFFGILSYSYATATNIRAPIWVVDPLVQQVGENQPLRDTDVDRVRSVEGVEWAAPLYVGNAQVKLLGAGATQSVTLVGLDADTLAGGPSKLVEGNIIDLRRAQGVIVDAQFVELMKEQRGEQLRLGDVFEMNDHEAVIVGIAKVTQGMNGAVYVFTTWDRAKEYASGQRKMLTHILAAPAPGKLAAEITCTISKETGLKAVTEAEFKEMSMRWMLYQTPIPFVVGLWVGIGFIIGLGISGQTFYTFVLENTRHLGTLKAMGVSNRILATMIVVQAGIVGFAGFGLGVGVISVFFSFMPEGRAPLVLHWSIPVIVFVAITLICMATALLCVWRVTRIEPAIVFRA